MTRLGIIIVLALAAVILLYTHYNPPSMDKNNFPSFFGPLITNRIDAEGVSGSISGRDKSQWEFVHCTSANKDCGRLE